MVTFGNDSTRWYRRRPRKSGKVTVISTNPVTVPRARTLPAVAHFTNTARQIHALDTQCIVITIFQYYLGQAHDFLLEICQRKSRSRQVHREGFKGFILPLPSKKKKNFSKVFQRRRCVWFGMKTMKTNNLKPSPPKKIVFRLRGRVDRLCGCDCNAL